MSGGHARKPGGGTSGQPAGGSTGSVDPTPGKRTRSEALGGGAKPAAPRPDLGDASAAEQHAKAGQASEASLERTIELAAVRMHGWAATIDAVLADAGGDGGPGKQEAEIRQIYDSARDELDRLWREVTSLHLDPTTKQAIATRTAGLFVAGWRQLKLAHDRAFAYAFRDLRRTQDDPNDKRPAERSVGAPAFLENQANQVLRELGPQVTGTAPASADPRLDTPPETAEALALAAAVTAIQDGVRAVQSGMTSASDGELLGDLAKLGAAVRKTEVLLEQINPSRIGRMYLLAAAVADIEALRGVLATRPAAAHALDRSLYALSQLHARLGAKAAGIDVSRHPLPKATNIGARMLGVRYVDGVTDPAESPPIELLLGAGSDQGVQPNMTGHVLDSGGRRIAHFTVEAVEANQCKGYVKGTPDMLRTATVIINPS